MDEYIERETAIAWFMPYVHAGESIDADVVISDIKGMKSADVAPVRHGRWILDEKRYVIYCSECGEVSGYSLNLKDVREENHYCPNCGAKMDLEDT